MALVSPIETSGYYGVVITNRDVWLLRRWKLEFSGIIVFWLAWGLNHHQRLLVITAAALESPEFSGTIVLESPIPPDNHSKIQCNSPTHKQPVDDMRWRGGWEGCIGNGVLRAGSERPTQRVSWAFL